MRRTPPGLWLQGFRSVTLVASGLAACARGTDDMVVGAGPPEQLEETVRFAPVNVHVLAGPGGRVAEYDLEAMFDQQLFGHGRGNRAVTITGRVVVDASGEVAARDTLARLAGMRSVGDGRIAALARVCGLSARQQAILKMAMESDLRRVAGEIDAVRQQYAGQRMVATAQGLDRERLQTLRDEAVACRRRIDRLWQTGSLFGPVSLGLLSPVQRAMLEDWMADRRAVRWEAMVRLVLERLDETVLGLTDKQHDALLEPLLADVPPLVVFDDPASGTAGSKVSNLQSLLVIHRLGRLDRAALRPRFAPHQWAALETVLARHGEPADVARLLVEQGILEQTELEQTEKEE